MHRDQRNWASRSVRPLALAVFVTACVVLTGSAWALQVPPLQQRVTDLATVLQPEQRGTLEQELAGYEQQTGHQFAVLTIPSLAGDPLEDFSMRVAEAWKVGDKKRDDGLLVLLALQERKVRIEVGYGLEGVVTDAVSSRVISEIMAPAFRRGDYATGLLAGLHKLMAVAQGEALGPAKQDDQRPTRRSQWVIPLIFLVALILLSRGRRGGGGGFFMPIPMGRGGWSSSGRGGWGGSGGGGGFSGGGGGFGGGGASGSW